MIDSLITGRYPRSAYAVALNRGPRGLGSRHGICVLGQITTSETGVVNVPVEVGSESEALALAGAGSDLHLGLVAASRNARGRVPIYACPVKAPSAGAVSTIVLTFTGTATAAGTLRVAFGTDVCEMPVVVGTTAANVGAFLDAAYDAVAGTQPFAPVVGSSLVAAFTATSKCKGTQSNMIPFEVYDIPAGLAVDDSDGFLAGGSGIGDYDDAADAVFGVLKSCDYFVSCISDAPAITTAGQLLDKLIAARNPGVGHLAHLFFGINSTEGVATTLSAGLDLGGTDFDEPSWACALCAGISNRATPAQLAGALAGRRAAETVVNRNAHWGTIRRSAVLAGIPAPRKVTNYPTFASIQTMLASGITPLEYDNATGRSKVVRSQTCKHVTAGGADFRGADSNIIDVMDYLAQDQSQALADEYGDCVIADDVDGREPENLPAKTVTASLMASSALARYKSLYCGTLLWCETHYRDSAGELAPIDDMFVFERDTLDSSKINGINAGVVRRWAMQISVRYEEIGY